MSRVVSNSDYICLCRYCLQCMPKVRTTVSSVHAEWPLVRPHLADSERHPSVELILLICGRNVDVTADADEWICYRATSGTSCRRRIGACVGSLFASLT